MDKIKPFKKKIEDTAEKVFIKTDKIIEKVSNSPKIVVKKFNNFVSDVKPAGDRKLIKILPGILLSLTVLAVKNKTLLRPFIKIYVSMADNYTGTFVGKLSYFISEYAKYLKSLPTMDLVDYGMDILTLVLEDIPNIFKRMYYTTGYDTEYTFSFYRNIVKNINQVKKNLDARQEPKKKTVPIKKKTVPVKKPTIRKR